MRRASSLVRGLLSGSVIARAMTSSSVKASSPCQSMRSFALVRAGFAPGPDEGRRALEVLAEVVVLLTPCRLPCRDNADALIAFGVGYRQCPPVGPADDDETILSVVLTVVYLINAGGIVEHESRALASLQSNRPSCMLYGSSVAIQGSLPYCTAPTKRAMRASKVAHSVV